MQVAIGDSSWPVLGNFEWTKIYYAQAAAPLRVGDILAGHMMFVVLPGAHQRRGVPRHRGGLRRDDSSAWGGAHAADRGPARHRRRRADLRLQRDDPRPTATGAAVPLRRDPDVAVRRRVLPGRVDARRRCAGWPTSRRCGTASTCAARPRSASRPRGRPPATSPTCCSGRPSAGGSRTALPEAAGVLMVTLVLPRLIASRARSAGPRRSPSATSRRCGPPTGS